MNRRIFLTSLPAAFLALLATVRGWFGGENPNHEPKRVSDDQAREYEVIVTMTDDQGNVTGKLMTFAEWLEGDLDEAELTAIQTISWTDARTWALDR